MHSRICFLSRVSVLAAASICVLTACSEDDAKYYPDIYFSGIPDLSQQDPLGGFAGGGDAFCAPVMASNSLVWLEANTDIQYQRELVNKLASWPYMRTNPNSGTMPIGVLQGVSRYLEETGKAYKRLEYAGWKRVQSDRKAEQALSREWLLDGLGSRSAVWLNLGWYETPFPGYYKRVSGHWVLLVGYRQGRFLIHDPGSRVGAEEDPQALEIEEVQPLLLRTSLEYKMPPPPLIELKKARSPNGERAFIDGAIILELLPVMRGPDSG